MRQADYAPYLEFVEKTPDMLNLNDPKKAQKSGRPLLFTEVAHDFASLWDIHRRRLNVANDSNCDTNEPLLGVRGFILLKGGSQKKALLVTEYTDCSA